MTTKRETNDDGGLCDCQLNEICKVCINYGRCVNCGEWLNDYGDCLNACETNSVLDSGISPVGGRLADGAVSDVPEKPSFVKCLVHTRDEDCSVDPRTWTCEVCGVDHSGQCFVCGGRGFHKDGCERIDRD